MSGFNTKEVNNNGDYEITFYTENREDFKKVQSLCRELIGNGKLISTEGDLISRSEAEKLGATCLARRNENGQLEAIISLDEAPTVEIPNYGGQVVPDTLQGWRYEERPQGEWIDYDNTFYKCPDCGYLLEKCCPQCQNKVILPKGGAE